MRLLFITQVVDKDDLYLGFTTRWIEEFATHYEQIEVICLKQGGGSLPGNVRVHSLGKERGPIPLRRLVYAVRFLRYAWQLRHDYDAVFVHMNQEYPLIAGWLWKLLHKPVYMWRNHYAGSVLTYIAAWFCTAIFCTSKYSYTARFRKTRIMPVGVDQGRFFTDGTSKVPHSILFFGRMAPSKHPLTLLEALRELRDRGVTYAATFVGSPLPEHESYYRNLVGRAEHYALQDQVTFLPGVPNDQAPHLFRTHEIFVNCSPSGMLDKVLFEAASCGAAVVAQSEDLRTRMPGAVTFSGLADDLADRLEAVLASPKSAMTEEELRKESLRYLADLVAELIDKKEEVPVVQYRPMNGATPLTNEYARQYYDTQVGALSGSYTDDRWHSSPVREFEYRQTLRALRAALAGKTYRNVLEIGPGDGVWTHVIGEYTEGKMHLVEQSGEMLAGAKRRLGKSADITFEHADFLTSVPPGNHDLIVALRCFEYFEDKEEAFRKMHALLAPGGKLVIITKNPELVTSVPAQSQTLHSDQASRRRMQRLARDAGYTLVSVFPAVLRWKAGNVLARGLFDALHRLAVVSRGRVVIPYVSNLATESYVYIFTA